MIVSRASGDAPGSIFNPASGFDYVVVGHVTVDVVTVAGRPRPRPGGAALYSGLQAARLGLRTLVLTCGRPDELRPLLAPYRDELALEILPSTHTTILLTEGSGLERRQRLRSWAGTIELTGVLDAPIVHLAPVAQETPRSPHCTGFVGITPQGLVRAWPPPSGEIVACELTGDALPERFDAAVFNAQELASCTALMVAARQAGSVVAITAGSGPTEIHSPKGLVSVPAPAPAQHIDDLGAGDVFAASFFAALHRGFEAPDAAAFGNAAAAIRIAGDGPSAIGDRPAIEALLN